MEYRELAAPARSPIERIWLARGAEGAGETILPDGRFELIFNLGDPVLQDGAMQPRAMLSAETRRAVSIEPSGRVEFIGVTLRDAHAAQVLRTPLHALRDRMLDLRAVVPRLDLLEQLAATREDHARAALIVRHLGSTDADPLAAHAASRIRAHSGVLSITQLAHSCGVTVRTLSRTFDRAFGMTAKTLARVVRLNRAASLLRAGESASSAAAGAGFFDQSHMTNEFRSMASLSPARWTEVAGSLGVHFLQDPPDGTA